MCGMRFSTARSKSSLIMTPMALASPAFMPTGKLRAQTARGGRLSVRAVNGAGVWRSSERSEDP